jgi:phosphopantetheinyl transferase
MRPAPGVMIAFWKITETEETLLQMYNPEAQELAFIQQLPAQRKMHYLASRLLAKTCYPEQSIIKDEFGKPTFDDNSVHFSWSHSGQFAAAIFNEKESTGIDVETIEPKILRIEDKFCNNTDKSHLHRSRHQESLLIIWGAKESMYKWYGKKEVDFKKHMTVGPFEMGESGRFSASFHKPDLQQDFIMEYAIFEEHVAVWINNSL